MQINSMAQSAVNGINTAQEMATQATSNIAQSSDLAGSIIQLKEAENMHAVNAEVLKKSNEMIGTIIDMVV
jgi:hypothetical protein